MAAKVGVITYLNASVYDPTRTYVFVRSHLPMSSEIARINDLHSR